MLKPIIMYSCENTKKIVVMKPIYWDYSHYDARWMLIDELDGSSMVPDVDILDEKFVFPLSQEGEQAALRKVAELYAEQINSKSGQG